MAIVGKNPYVKNFFSAIGASRHSLAGNTGRMFIRLIPRNERPGVEEIIQQFRPQLATVPGIRVFMQNLPPIRIGGVSRPRASTSSPSRARTSRTCTTMPPCWRTRCAPCRGWWM